MTPIKAEGMVFCAADIHALLPDCAFAVKSWDNDSAPASQRKTREAVKGFLQATYMESTPHGRNARGRHYCAVLIYRNHEERRACFAAMMESGK